MGATRTPTVLIAGGGPAALEGALALRRRIPEARVELVAPDEEFVYRPMAVAEPFGREPARRFPLSRLTVAAGAELRRDALTAVATADREAILASGARLTYDSLLIALGARPVEALPGAVTFWGSDGDPAFGRVLRRIEEDAVDVVFAVPYGVPWSVPLYELALGTAEWCRGRGLSPALSVVTPEHEPVAIFDGAASAAVDRMLSERGIELRLSTDPIEFCPQLAPGAEPHPAEVVVSLPRLVGRGVPDLRCDEQRFLPVDDFGRVRGAPGVYAAGDVTASTIKQGGLSAQQADSAASAIAADLTGSGAPEPLSRILRGRVLDGSEGVTYLRRDLRSRERSVVADVPLWWPAAKIFGKHLAPFLAHMARLEEDLPAQAS